MKKLTTLFVLLILVFSCNKVEPLPPNVYEINVIAKGTYNGVRAYLKDPNTSRRATVITDTAIIVNEKFTFRGTTAHSAIRNLSINSVPGLLPIVLEPGHMTIEIYKDSIQYSKVDGPKNNTAFTVYTNEIRKKSETIKELRAEMNSARSNNDNTAFNELAKKKTILNQDLNNYIHDFVNMHSELDISLLLLGNLNTSRQPMNIDKLKKNLTALDAIINKNSNNKTIANKLRLLIASKEAEEKVNIGKIAPDFSGTTPEGKTISLNDIKGKATIIDFWAAWCAPCRRENPNVVRVYDKFHDKGLEIISISLDGRSGQREPKEAWLKAIDDDKLNWHHVSNLNYFNDPVVKLYNVNAIPATFILDENGVIVSKRLRGQALENKIAELLN